MFVFSLVFSKQRGYFSFDQSRLQPVQMTMRDFDASYFLDTYYTAF
jgi:hypothetical protein